MITWEETDLDRITLTNDFHHTEVTIIPKPDHPISAATYRRARRQLCPSTNCRCGSSSASGWGMLVLGQAEPVYAGSRIVAYRLWELERVDHA